MAIERARAILSPKPWGVTDVSAWSPAQLDGQRIGEISYERAGTATADTLLLFKLLFTSAPLSIQVHPDDRFARVLGLDRGKSEGWYVLGASPGAKVALGLSERLTPQQLREAAGDGSISNFVVWKAVFPGDAISVPAGTIHAIGAGLVIAEIQQRSDATFRLFDHGSQRELHIESAIAVADTGPAGFQLSPARLSDHRDVMISDPHFVLERIDLPPNSSWCLDADRETWMLVLSGQARIGSFDVVKGSAVFAEQDRVEITVGSVGLIGLVAHAGAGLPPDMVRFLQEPSADDLSVAREIPVLTPDAPALVETESELVERTR